MSMPPATRTRSTETRIALFDAGIRLMRKRGFEAVTLASVGEAAGVTRQAVYLHFGSRAGYLTALVEHANDREGITDGVARALAQPSAEKALRAMVRLRATTAPRLEHLITAMGAAPPADTDAARIRQERQRLRLEPLLAVTRRFRTEKRLRRGLSADDAATLLLSLLSFEAWSYLVATGGWSKDKYVRVMYATALRAIT